MLGVNAGSTRDYPLVSLPLFHEGGRGSSNKEIHIESDRYEIESYY
jgi:hypothetical protein